MLAFCLFAFISFNADPAPTADQLRFFEEKIRPVLVEQCQNCHSAKAASQKKLKGGLALDSREAWLKGGDSGQVILPGKPEASLLIKSLHHEDDLKMPPKGKLSKAVIADFERWVKMGAPDPRVGANLVGVKPARVINFDEGRSFWSFRPLQVVPPPTVASPAIPGWPRNPVDQFVLAKLQAKGIRPNPAASPRILVRRAWLDLLGIPPTPEQMTLWSRKLDAGGGKIKQQAWEELIDQLLASPYYGERWARHWMDVARFAESHGYEQDYDRPTAYTYRDFLIKAFNADLPFDKFARWQLAGDELEPNNPLAWMATGFLGAGAFPTQLTETEFESARYDELDDMVNTTGVAFLGLTLGCARCHDHKFDPIAAKDYYRFAAAFSNVIRSEKELDLDPTANAERAGSHAVRLKNLEEDLAKFERKSLPTELEKYLKSSTNDAQWILLDGELKSTAKTQFVRQADGSYLAIGKAPPREVLTFSAVTTARNIQSIRLEVLSDQSFPHGGPGRAANGNFVLGNLQVDAAVDDAKGAGGKVSLARAEATHQQNTSSLSVGASLDNDPESGWAVDGQIGKSQAAVFYLAKPLNDEGKRVRLTVTLGFNHPNPQHVVGRFRLSITNQAGLKPAIGEPGPDAQTVAALERLRRNQPQAGDQAVALKWFKQSQPAWVAKWASIQKEKADGGKPVLTKALVTTEGMPHLPHHADDRGFPHFYKDVHLLRRGDVGQKVELVSHGVPEVFNQNGLSLDAWRVEKNPDSKSSYKRSALAKWLTDPAKGAGNLVARVAVNRLWQHHFGQGIVTTPSDFGYMGAKPTHPELLEWLAGELIKGDWKLKRMHKLMLCSATYMQSTSTDAERLAKDPEGQWLWRRLPHRLEAEAIRDSLLVVSGQLDSRQFGSGTLDQNMKRRSIYFSIKRSGLIPMMMLFDWPEHLVSIGQRSNTTVAPQALAFLNGPQVRAYALAFADRLGADSAPEQAVEKAFNLALGRSPNQEEAKISLEFLANQEALRGLNRDAKRAAMADLCQTIFSMNEFIFVE